MCIHWNERNILDQIQRSEDRNKFKNFFLLIVILFTQQIKMKIPKKVISLVILCSSEICFLLCENLEIVFKSKSLRKIFF
jgi:hypothetical protein